jgi:hypothetical protein
MTKKERVRVIRDGTEEDNNLFVKGLTLHWGYKIGLQGDNNVLVQFTDSDNKVKIKSFACGRVI